MSPSLRRARALLLVPLLVLAGGCAGRQPGPNLEASAPPSASSAALVPTPAAAPSAVPRLSRRAGILIGVVAIAIMVGIVLALSSDDDGDIVY